MKKLLFIAAVGLVLTACTTTRVVEVEKVTHDTTYVSKMVYDSIYMHDSVYVSEKGDTVRIERWHTKYVSKEVHDTLYLATHDTIPQPYSVTQYVEKPLSAIERVLIIIGCLAIMALLVFIVLKIKPYLPCR